MCWEKTSERRIIRCVSDTLLAEVDYGNYKSDSHILTVCGSPVCELTASITAIANWLACQLTEDELNLLGASLTQLGDTLITIATQKSFCRK